MATLRNDTVIRSADGQGTSAIVTASNIGTYGVATNSTYYVGTTQNIFNRASGAQTLTGVSIDGNAATVTNGLTTGNYNSYALPLAGGTLTGNLTITKASAYLYINGTNSDAELRFLANSSDRWAMGMNVGDATENLNIYNYTTATTNFTILKASGNVGVGTASPSYKLDVSGAINASTYVYAGVFYDNDNTVYYTNPSGTSNLVGLTVANTIAGSVSGNAATATTSALLTSSDVRTISPSSANAGRLTYGFTSYSNNNTGSWADYLHLRSYTDGTGGNDNLVMFNKNAIGMRIWQQAFGSATAYATYKDVAFTDQGFYIGTTSVAINRSSASQTLTGVSIDGNAATVTNGLYTSSTLTAGNLSGTIPSGVLGNSTHYVGTTAIALNRGSASQTLTGVSIDGNAATATNGLTTSNYVSYSAFTASLTSTVDARAPIFYDSNNTAYYIDGASGSKLKYLQIDGDWGSSPFGSGHESFTIRSTYASMVQRQTNGALAYWLHHIPTDGSYMLYGGRGATDGSAWDWALRAYPNQDGNYVEFNTSARAQIFYDRNDTTYYTDPASTSRLNTLNVVGAVSAARGVFSDSSGSGSAIIEAYNTVATNGTTAIFRQTTAGGNGNQDIGLLVDIQGAADTDRIANFRYYNGSTYTSRMAIMRGGNVGIGTTSPSASLHIKPTSLGANGFILERYATTAKLIYAYESAADGYLEVRSGADVIVSKISGYASTATYFQSSVGVGATAPDTNLQVVGHVHVGNQTTFENAGGWNKTIYLDGLIHARMRILGSAYASGKNSVTETYIWVDNSVAPYSGLATNAGSFQISAGFTTILNSARSPIFYDSDNTAYYCDPNGVSNLYGVAIRGDVAGANTDNQIFFWGTGNTTTSAIGFKSNSGVFPNPTGNGDGYNTYLTMDTDGRGWVFRRGVGGTDFTSAYTAGWILNNGIWQANASMRAPIFYDSNDTAYYLDAAGTSRLNTTRIGNINVGSGTYLNTITPVGDTNINLSAPSGAFYFDTFPRMPGFYDSNDTNYYVDPASTSILNGTRHNTVVAGSTSAMTSAGQLAIYSSANPYISFHDGGVGRTAYMQETGGRFYFGEVTYTESEGSFRAPLFYDTNDTGYYCDPAGESKLNYLRLTNSNALYFTTTSVAELNNEGNSTNVAFRMIKSGSSNSDGNNYGVLNLQRTNHTNGATNAGGSIFFELKDSGGTIREYAGISGCKTEAGAAGGRLIFHRYARTEVGYWDADQLYSSSSVRSLIFYDSDNTAYYLNPNSTTSLRTVGSWRSDSSTWDGEFSGKIQYHSNHWYFQSGDLWIFRNSGGTNVATINQSGVISAAFSGSLTGNVTGTAINIAGNGAGYDTYGTIGVTEPAGASNYSYYGLTRQSNIGCGFGLTGTTGALGLGANAFWFGSATSTAAGVMGSAYIAFNGSTLVAVGTADATQFRDRDNTAYYVDPASTSNINGLTVAGGNATIYRDLIVNGGGSGNFGNRIIVQGTATTYTYQDTTLRPTVYLNGEYPVVTLNATATTNANHGPTLQFAFNGLTTGGTTSRQIVIGANGVGSWLDFGFSGGANGDNSSYNPHNGISGYNGVTAMRLFSNGLLVGSTGTYPSHVTSTSFALDVRGTGSSNTDFRAPIFYDSANTGYYLDPAGNSQVVSIYANDWFRAQGNTGLYFQDKGYGITSAGGASNSYGNASTYGTGLNGWQGWGIGSRHCMMSTGADNFGVHDNTRGWLYYWNGTYHNFQYGYLESASSVRAPLFYDSNNTTYYVDPASTGYSAYFAGAIQAAKIGIEDGGLDCYMEITDANPTVYGVGYGGEFIFYGDKSTPASFLYYGGATVTYTLQANSSLRSPIFYDSNDTGYYIDAASTSILNVVRANSYVQKSASQSLSGTVGCTIDVAAAGIHVLTLAASTTISSFTYNYRAPNPSVNTIMLVIKYGGTASITWTNVLWANGVTPTITGVSGYADVYMLTSYQGTTGVWIGTVVSQGVVSTSL